MTHSTGPKRVRLALSTGEVYEGWGFGASVERAGEVVFNTSVSGYQESISDPSYNGQILVQTAPMIGNTGFNVRDMESRTIQVSGLVVHESVDRYSNYRSRMSLHEGLERAGVPGIWGVDTRSLTQLLRSGGLRQGVLSGDPVLGDRALVERAKGVDSMVGKGLALDSGVQSIERWDSGNGEWERSGFIQRLKALPVGVIDCGAKDNILRCLMDVGCDPILLPISTSIDDLKGMLVSGKIHGVFLSNGPGDPSSLTDLIATIRELIHDPELSRFPLYGICLGHQIIALAHGAKTSKLKFGHRGINHPVFEPGSGRVCITSQNHGFVVDFESCIDLGLEITHIHLNDKTVAGLARSDRPIRCVQFHPESSPGPHDAGVFFERFSVDIRHSAGVASC